MRFMGDDDDMRQANYVDEFINAKQRQFKNRENKSEIIIDLPDQDIEVDIKTNGSFDANALAKKVKQYRAYDSDFDY